MVLRLKNNTIPKYQIYQDLWFDVATRPGIEPGTPSMALTQPVSALTNWAMSASTVMDGHNPEPNTLDWLDTSESPPSSLHFVATT